jgi:hypothetical protein
MSAIWQIVLQKSKTEQLSGRQLAEQRGSWLIQNVEMKIQKRPAQSWI